MSTQPYDPVRQLYRDLDRLTGKSVVNTHIWEDKRGIEIFVESGESIMISAQGQLYIRVWENSESSEEQ